MKRTCVLMVSLALALAAAVTGCGHGSGPPDTPGDAYERLFSAMRRKDMGAALRCVDEPTARFLKAARAAEGTWTPVRWSGLPSDANRSSNEETWNMSRTCRLSPPTPKQNCSPKPSK